MVFMSPVYLIQPPFAFHKSVTLSIKLFAILKSKEECENTVFVTSPTRAVEKDENAQWNFKTYGSPKCSEGSRNGNGEIELTHFCLTSFAAKFGML